MSEASGSFVTPHLGKDDTQQPNTLLQGTGNPQKIFLFSPSRASALVNFFYHKDKANPSSSYISPNPL